MNEEMNFALGIKAMADAVNSFTVNEEGVAGEIIEGLFRGVEDGHGRTHGPVHPTLRQVMGRILKSLIAQMDAHYQKFPPDGREWATADYIHKLNEAGQDTHLPFV
jgi:hypothetical protein